MDLESIKNNPEQIKLLISILSALLPETNTVSAEKPVRKTKAPKPKKTIKNQRENRFDGEVVKTARSKARSQAGVNYFESMPEKSAHKEDTEIDKKLSKYPPTARRPEVTMIKVQCRSCGKKEKVSPSLLLDKDRYKCNKCSSTAG